MNRIKLILLSSLIFLIQSCKDTGIHYDASGTFEAKEIIVSAETTGKILTFNKEEGDLIKENELVIVIDTALLVLQRNQALSTMDAVSQKQNSAAPQVDILKQQLKAADADLTSLNTQLTVLIKEQIRVNNLYAARAATEQVYDEINGKVDVMEKNIESAEAKKRIINTQIASAKTQINIQNRGVTSEKLPIEKQIEIINEQIRRSKVKSPIDGSLLSKYAEEGEMIMTGKPLYKLADMSNMELKAYVTGDQLPQIKLGQKVEVFVDQDADNYKSYEGEIIWIADKAEFTPKTIQTKNERANLVYAVKIKVKNDGYIKIGMYGEIALTKTQED
jgi:HlyD family secretion protein